MIAAVPAPLRRCFRDLARWLGIALLLAQAGCATLPPAAPEGARDTRAPAPARPSTVEPPPANVNLSGFPLPYRQGYADGCASAAGGERKDSTRFAADGNYRTGWQDGRAICAKK